MREKLNWLSLLIDAAIVLVLVWFITVNARRGLVRAAAVLLSMIISTVGAGLISSTIAPAFTNIAVPMVEDRIVEQVNAALEQTGTGVTSYVENLGLSTILEAMGLDETLSQVLESRAREKIQETGVTALTAVVESMAERAICGIVFAVCFALLSFISKTLIRGLKLASHLPGLQTLDRWGGCVLGALEGLLVLYVVIWFLRRFDVSLETEPISQTYILQFFATHSPLAALSFLGE